MESPSPELLFALSPAVLRALVATFGPLDGVKPNAPVRAVVRAMFEGRAPAKLARVLAVVARFGTDSGLRAIVEAAAARRDARGATWMRGPAGDVAAALATESATAKGATKRAADRVLALAGLRMDRELGERATYELTAATPVDVAGAARSIARAFGAEVVETWAHREDAGAKRTRVAVFVRQPATMRFVLEDGAIGARVETPVAVDLVRVDASGTRVSLTLATPERLPRYATALGLALRPSFTLRPFHDLTRETLAGVKLPRGVSRVTVVALRRRRSDGARKEMRAFDALDPAIDEAASWSGYVDRSTVRVEIGERAVDAFLQLPHRIEISDEAFDAPVRAVLAAMGLFDPGAMADDARSLAPYVHGDWRWRSVVGDAFEAMVAAKLLTKVIAAHVATEEHRMHGAGYVVRDVPGEKGVQYALAEDRSLGARLVGREDRAAWALDLGKLAAGMRADLGAVAVGKPGAVEIDGVIDLGVVTLPSGKLRFAYAMGVPAKGWLAAVRRACGIGVTLVVLVPRGWKDAGTEGVLVVELDVLEQLGAKRVGRALGKAAEALGVEGEVEAWRVCEEEIVVDAKTQRVWVAGVAVSLTEKPYRLVEYLARHLGHVTATSEIGAYVSSSGYPDVAARRTKQELEKQVRAALQAAGVDVGIVARLIVVDGRKGYRLGVSAKVV